MSDDELPDRFMSKIKQRRFELQIAQKDAEIEICLRRTKIAEYNKELLFIERELKQLRKVMFSPAKGK